MQDNYTITVTFSEAVENHVGMQQIGTRSQEGFTFQDLQRAQQWFEQHNVECYLIDLKQYLPDDYKQNTDDAYLLVARQAVDTIVDSNKLYQEQFVLEKDTKAFMYGRVVNKKARHNLCFADHDQVADYPNGKGTVVAFSHLPYLSALRDQLDVIVGDKAQNMLAEANYYYDTTKTFISMHGDTERKRVIGIRLGSPFTLHYQWYHKSQPVGPRMEFPLVHGDIYIMSEKTVGFDWKKKNIPTLRHAAGDVKNILKGNKNK